MKTQVIYRDLMIFNVNADNYSKANPGTKISKVLDSVTKANKELIEGYKDEVDEINLDTALVDTASNPPKIVYDDIQAGIFAMDKEGKRKQRQRIRDLNNRPVDVTFKHLDILEIPHDLHPDLRAVFTPFVIAPVPDEELIEVCMDIAAK